MNSNASKSRAEVVALARFSLVSRIQELLRQPVPLKVALDTVASSSPLELEGKSELVPRRTLEDWWYAYQRGGFAALHPKGRSDRGVPRVLTPEQERPILEQVKAYPAIPVKGAHLTCFRSGAVVKEVASLLRALLDLAADSEAFLIHSVFASPAFIAADSISLYAGGETRVARTISRTDRPCVDN